MSFPLVGIENKNEFYSQHYLDEVLEQDLKELFARWQDREVVPHRRGCERWPESTCDFARR